MKETIYPRLISTISIDTLATGSNGNCYIIGGSKSKLMIECGLPAKKIKRKGGFKLYEISACLISHRHGDHSKAAKDLLNAGIDCYMLQDVKDFLNTDHHRAHVFEPGKQFEIEDFTILPFHLNHFDPDGTPCPNAGFLIASGKEKLLYITDAAFCEYTFTGLTHIMLEANYSDEILAENIRSGLVHGSMKERLLYSHMSLANAIELLNSNDLSKVKEIHLIHLSKMNADPEQFQKKIQELFGIPVGVVQ